MILKLSTQPGSGTYVIVSLSLLFGWLLSFPFHGPVLTIFCEFRSLDPGLTTRLFIFFHAAGIFLAGITLKKTFSWQLIIRAAALCTLAAAAALPISPAKLLPFIFSCAGASSGVFIIAWSLPFSLHIPPAHRIRVMAAIIVLANLIYLSVKFSLLLFRPAVGQGIAFAALCGAGTSVLFMNPRENRCRKTPRIHARFPVLLLALLSGTIFFLYINGGFMYQVIYPAAPGSMPWLPLFRDLVYIFTLLSAAVFGPRIDRVLPVYASAALMVLAFGCYSLFKSLPAGWLGTEVLIHASMALLDLFLWTVLGDIAFRNGQPFRVFGWGLAANVAGILAGVILGEWLFAMNENPGIIIAVSTGTTVSLTFLFIPLLAARMTRDLLE